MLQQTQEKEQPLNTLDIIVTSVCVDIRHELGHHFLDANEYSSVDIEIQGLTVFVESQC